MFLYFIVYLSNLTTVEQGMFAAAEWTVATTSFSGKWMECVPFECVALLQATDSRSILLCFTAWMPLQHALTC